MKKYILSGLIGFGISVLCLLPPFIHFITGPLGPLIGGFAGGMKARSRFDGALAIGLIMGLCLSLFLATIGFIIVSFRVSLPGMMNTLISNDSLTAASVLKLSFIPFAVATLLGTIGAFLGGKMANKAAEETA